jgi:hypothetical protein
VHHALTDGWAGQIVNVVNRWDLVPRAQLLPDILRREGSKRMVQDFTRHLTQRLGGYAARFGGYISDALSIPHNFNRTMQGKRVVLGRYETVGTYIAVPPGVPCDFAVVAATSTPPQPPPRAGRRGADRAEDGAWSVRVGEDVSGAGGGAGAGSNGAGVAAMLGDHQRVWPHRYTPGPDLERCALSGSVSGSG